MVIEYSTALIFPLTQQEKFFVSSFRSREVISSHFYHVKLTKHCMTHLGLKMYYLKKIKYNNHSFIKHNQVLFIFCYTSSISIIYTERILTFY